jgi:beta-glucosidase/6-phospho-beta-glucosidase/beta-galactosidase
MNFILTYITIGVLLAWGAEVLANYLEKHLNKFDLTKDITWGVRVMGIVIWPFCLIVFVYNYIKTKYRL